MKLNITDGSEMRDQIWRFYSTWWDFQH